jgi:hypothetical protein
MALAIVQVVVQQLCALSCVAPLPAAPPIGPQLELKGIDKRYAGGRHYDAHFVT